MFSPAYVEALKDILDLEEEAVAALERQLATQPDDPWARLKLMAYSMRADQAGRPESRERRAGHVLWLIEYDPESEILGSPYASFGPGQMTPEEYQRARELWEHAVTLLSSRAGVMWNAANFFGGFDRNRNASYVRRAALLDPENYHYGHALGGLYAEAIVAATRREAVFDGRGTLDPGFAQQARRELDTTNNAAVLEAASGLLQREYNRSLMMGSENPEVGALAQRLFRKAEALNPGLDKAWVLPQIDPKMVGMFKPGARPPEVPAQTFDAAKIRRLPPDAFPQLPAKVADALKRRKCLVPQWQAEGPPGNVISGEFFAQGQTGWAVLCSVEEQSTILVFRNNSDASPVELAKADDRGYLQSDVGGVIVYSRGIAAVDRDYIVRHYRAYGGTEPPPIDHQGIDDAFLEKASIVHYWYQDKWLQLTGAD